MLTLRNLTKSFNSRILFQNADMTVNDSERVALGLCRVLRHL